MPKTPQSETRSHGSSLDSYHAGLDQERAASMADEGGVAGARTDAREQMAAVTTVQQVPTLWKRPTTTKRALPTWLLWSAIVVGCSVLFRRLGRRARLAQSSR